MATQAKQTTTDKIFALTNELLSHQQLNDNFDENYYYRLIIVLQKLPGLFRDQIVQIVQLLKFYRCPFNTLEDGVKFFLNLKLGNKKRMTYWALIEENRIFKILTSYEEFKTFFPDQHKKLNKAAKCCLKLKPSVVLEFGVRRTTTKPAYFGKLPPLSYSLPTRLDTELTKLIYGGTKSYFNPSKKIAGDKELFILQYIHKYIFRPTLKGNAKLVYNKKTIKDYYSGI